MRRPTLELQSSDFQLRQGQYLRPLLVELILLFFTPSWVLKFSRVLPPALRLPLDPRPVDEHDPAYALAAPPAQNLSFTYPTHKSHKPGS